MKKIMTLLGVTAFALGAFAYTANQVGFEDYTVGQGVTDVKEPYGQAAEAQLWYAEDPDNASVVTSYVGSGVSPYPYGTGVLSPLIPAEKENAPGDNYLSVESGSKPLYRSLGDNAGYMPTFQDIPDGIVADTLVQFTPSDSLTQTLDDGAKFALWLYAPGEDAEGDVTTNLCVAAGGSADGSVATFKLAVPGVEIKPNEWHRVTIRAYTDVVTTGDRLGFVVYVDGQMATCINAGDYADAFSPTLTLTTQGLALKAQKALFLGVFDDVNLTQNTELAAVGFKGTGKVDDVSIVAADAAAAIAPDPTGLVLTWDEGVLSFTVAGNTYITANIPQGCVLVPTNGVDTVYPVTIDWDSANGYGPDTTKDYTYTLTGSLTAGETISGTQANVVIGTTSYSTIADAVAALEEDDTVIKVVKSYTETIDPDGLVGAGIQPQYACTIDLNGKTVTFESPNNIPPFFMSNDITVFSSENGGKFIIGEDCVGAAYFESFQGKLIIGKKDGDAGVTIEGVLDAAPVESSSVSLVRGFFTDAGVGNYVADDSVCSEEQDEDGYWVVTPAPFDFTVWLTENARVWYKIDAGEFIETNETAVVAVPYDSTITVKYAAAPGFVLGEGSISEKEYANDADSLSSEGQVTVEAGDDPVDLEYALAIVIRTSKELDYGEDPENPVLITSVDTNGYLSLRAAIKAATADDVVELYKANNSENVTIADGKVVNFSEGDFTFSGTFDGAGTVAMTAKPKAVGAARFAETWTGTFQVCWDEGNNRFVLDDFGNANSTVEIVGNNHVFSAFPFSAWSNGDAAEVQTKVAIAEGTTWTVANGNAHKYDSDWNITTFPVLTGGGNLVVNGSPNGTEPIEYEIAIVTNFTGTLSGNRGKYKFGNIAVAGTPGFDDCLVKVGNNFKYRDLDLTTVNEAAATLAVGTVSEQKGVYLARATVAGVGYVSIDEALAAADSATVYATTVTVFDTDSASDDKQGWSYSDGVYTSTREIATVDGTPYASLASAIAAAVANEKTDVVLLAATSEAVTIPQGITVSVTDDVVFSGKLSGAGAIRYTKAPTSFVKGNLLASNWTGTYVADYEISGAFNFNAYGTESSIVEIADRMVGWPNLNAGNITTTVKVTGYMEFSDGTTTWRPEFSKLTGDGVVTVTSSKRYTFVSLEDWNGELTNAYTSVYVTNIVSGTGKVVYTVFPQDAGAPVVGSGFSGEVVLRFNANQKELWWYGSANSTIVLTDISGDNTFLPNGDFNSKVRVDGTVAIKNGNPLTASDSFNDWTNDRVITTPYLKVDGALSFAKTTGAGKSWSNLRCYYYAKVLDASGSGTIEVGNQFGLRIDAVDFAAAPGGTGCLVPLTLTAVPYVSDETQYVDVGRLYGPNGVDGEQIPVTVNGEATEQSLVYDAEKGGLVLYVAPTPVAVPTAATGLTYDGTEQTGVAAGTGYTLTGNTGKDAGSYQATATLESGYVWEGGATEAQTIEWSIAQKSVTATITLTVASASLDAEKTTVGAYTAVDTVSFDGDTLTVDDDYTISGLDAQVSAAGDYDVTVQPVENGNYTFEAAKATLTITSSGGSDWKDQSETEGKTAGEAYGLTGDIAAADATTLTTWAKGTGNVDFSNKDSINTDCYLLNIANDSTAEQIAAAKAAFGITSIDIVNGVPVIGLPEGYNGVIELEGATELTKPMQWHPKTTGDTFFRAVLNVSSTQE